MKYYSVFKNIKNYMILFYKHCLNEINRMDTIGVDLDDYIREKSYILRKDSYCIEKIKETEPRVEPYGCVIDILNSQNVERAQIYELVKGFGDMLIYAEKYLLYPNDDSKEMYSVYYNENSMSVFFDINDATVECKFNTSSINVGNRIDLPYEATEEQKNAIDKILGISHDEYEIFVEIEIKRHFGNDFVSNYKSILGSNEFNMNKDDIWMMDLIEIHMKKIMLETLTNIKEHILTNCLGVTNLTVKDFENGVELWRFR